MDRVGIDRRVTQRVVGSRSKGWGLRVKEADGPSLEHQAT